MSRPGRRHRLPLHERPVHRPLPRPARAVDEAHQGVQAPVGRGRVLARRREPRSSSPASTAPRSSPRTSSTQHLERLEEARARDHRRLGQQLGLFTFSDGRAGHGVLAAEGHARVQRASSPLSREMGEPRGYTEVKTPQIYDAALWKTSGHWGKYRENMFLTQAEDRADGGQADELPGPRAPVRPAAVVLPRPARALLRAGPAAPQRAVRRAARPACACGTSRRTTRTSSAPRSRSRTRSPAAWTSPSTPTAIFGLEPHLELSTRPENRLGSDELWDHAEGALEQALESRGLAYTVNEGDGAFYGPKIDLHVTDSLGRSWQLGTVQLDYSMPERFGLTYTGADNADHQPVMIHRALMGSYERFIGILLEDTRRRAAAVARAGPGARPADRRPPRRGGARGARASCARRACAREVDDRTESVGRKIRDAELRKVPYMLVVGDREAEERHRRRPRRHREGDTGHACPSTSSPSGSRRNRCSQRLTVAILRRLTTLRHT